MKILSLVSENIKKLVAVEIKPDGNMVIVSGANGAGKSSTLDSIWWALTGARHIQSVPIRKGANEARIRLDLGEIIVIRKFRKRDDGSFATELAVENAAGARFRKPQDILDGLLDALSFDPLAFSRSDPKAQFNALRRFAPDVDFAAIDGKNKTDFEARTDVNRQEREARAAAGQIAVPDGTPPDPIDESGIVAQLEKAGEHNADIEARKMRRQSTAEAVTRLKGEQASLVKRATDIRKQADDLDNEASVKEGEWLALQKKIDEAPPLPEPIDTAAVRAAIENARRTNAAVASRKQREVHVKRADELKVKADTLTATMAKRNADKAAAIANAKLPVEGLGFGDGVVLFNGLPFDQASDAEQLRVSVAIAMAGDPKLRVIRIRDGSLLDENGMQLLAEMAEKHDMQVWLEKVDTTGKMGFVIEDGRLRDAPEAQGEAA